MRTYNITIGNHHCRPVYSANWHDAVRIAVKRAYGSTAIPDLRLDDDLPSSLTIRKTTKGLGWAPIIDTDVQLHVEAVDSHART